MNMISESLRMESPALRWLRPATPLYGKDGALLDNARRKTGSSSETASPPENAGNLATDATGLSLSSEEIRQTLEYQERNQPALSQEQAYIAAGRAARHHETAALSGLAASMQSRTAPTAPSGSVGAWAAGPQAEVSAPESSASATGRDRGLKKDVSAAGESANTGGAEARSAERAFVGSLSRGSGSSGNRTSNGTRTTERNEEEEQAEVKNLQKRDREVRAHEQAHISAAGGLASGGASYQKTRGPDGNMYAVAGEVRIDTSEETTPEATIAKARQIKSAALAPAQPSAQDRQVAAQAAQMEAQARQEQAASDSQTAGWTEEASAGNATAQARPGDSETIERSTTEQDDNGFLQHSHLTRRAGKAYERTARHRFTQYGTGLLSIAV